MRRYISVLLVTGLVSAGCTKPGLDAPTATSARPAPKSSPPISLKATELGAQVKSDFHETFDKYKDKTLEIEGIVNDRRPYGDQKLPYLSLDGFKSKLNAVKNIDVHCLFPASKTNEVLEFAPGQTVKVRGMLLGTLNRITLGECSIVAAGPSTAIRLTAEELVREYVAHSKATARKYRDAVLFVSGTVLELDSSRMGQQQLRFVLKGADGPDGQSVNVTVETRWDEHDAVTAGKAAAVRVGQQRQVSGQVAFTVGSNPVMSGDVDLLDPGS